jgi:hypothetical protein
LAQKNRSLARPLNSRQLSHVRSVSEGVRPTSSDSFHSALAPEDVYIPPKLELSESNLAKLNRSQKALPLRPSFSMGTLIPRLMIDKDLPPIPRRPVPIQVVAEVDTSLAQSSVPKVTKDDIEIGRKMWSLFPAPSKSMDLARPATSGGIGHMTKISKSWSRDQLTQHPLRSAPRPADSGSHREVGPVHSRPSIETGRSSTTERFVRLKRSFSTIGTKSGRPSKQRSNSVVEHRRKWSVGLPSKMHVKRTIGIKGSHVRNKSPSATTSTNQNDSTSTKSEPIGIYDPVSKMWLIPPTIAGPRLGIYDPESQQWLTPSPRSDSYRKTAPVQVTETPTLFAGAVPNHSSSDEIPEEGPESETLVQESSQVLETEPSKKVETGGDAEEIGENEEQGNGALSLAEKLEIIRYNPLTRTLSSAPNTTLRNQPSTIISASDSMDSDHIIIPANRPWKPSRILGVSTPPDGTALSALAKYEDVNVFSEKTAHPIIDNARSSIESGSGYMSFESDYDGKKKDWKGLWKKLKGSNNTKKHEIST